jgi:hypothetical protein
MKLNFTKSQYSTAAFVAVVIGAAAIEGTVFARAHHTGPARDVFLSTKVDTIDQLVSEIKKNPTLRRNYAKHFGISEDKVVDFVKRTLVKYKLPEGRSVTTYGVTKAGHIYPVKMYLKKGTYVWATHSGLPILKWSCANPLGSKLPGTLLPGLASMPKDDSLSRNRPSLAYNAAPELVTPPINPLDSVAAPLLAAPSNAPGLVSSALNSAPDLSGAQGVIIPAVTSAPLPAIAASGSATSLLPLIPLLVGASLGAHSSTSGTATTVPEPGSVALLALAGAPLLIGTIGKRRRRISSGN